MVRFLSPAPFPTRLIKKNLDDCESDIREHSGERWQLQASSGAKQITDGYQMPYLTGTNLQNAQKNYSVLCTLFGGDIYFQ